MQKFFSRMMFKKMGIIFSLIFLFSGCTIIFQRGRRTDLEKISELSSKLDELSRAKESLEKRLMDEINAKEVSLSMQDRGLVVTFISEVLFDSGKDVLKEKSKDTLNKVVDVLQTEIPGMDIRIEGHTDNVPIKYSKWKTNWELSSHRALSVLHYLESKGIAPERLSATGYGEFRPVASNDTAEGRQKNRRVEIVIYPSSRQIKKDSSKSLIELKENLK